MTKHKILHFAGGAFALSLLIVLSQVTTGHAQRSAGKPDSVLTWSFGATLPNTVVRSVGVFFPANGNFYSMGGRSADGTGNDLLNPFEYKPGTNTWATKAGTFSSNYVNNMACGVLTQAGTPYIFCVGGSFGGGTDAINRVTRYDPVADVFTDLTAADNWPGDPHTTGNEVLPGGFVVVGNKLYVIGGFNINTGMSHTTWVFDPNAAVGSRWTQLADYPQDRGYIPTTVIGNVIYTAGGSLWDGTTIDDTNDSYKYDIATNTWTAITVIPRATAETRALNVDGVMWVLGGGRDNGNPVTEIDVYNPYCNSWSISNQPFQTARRNFPADTNGQSRVWLGGGYAPSTPDNTFELYKEPTLNSAASVRTHGAAGDFGIPLNINGPTAIESRFGTSDRIVATFATNVTVTGATVTCGTGAVGSVTGSGTPTITVNLTGVTDVQRITVTINGVNDGTSTADIPLSMGILVADVTANGSVNAGDVAFVKSKVGQTVGAGNFRADINDSGTITATDVSICKSDVGHSLPPQ